MAIKPGRPVAMGIIDGTPLIGLPGNPVASFVTFVHVVRPTVLALAGALQGVACADAGARRLQLQEEDRAAANMSGPTCAGPQTARWRRSSFRAKARGCCPRWWIRTDWSNSAKQVTQVEPGQTVGFLAYASLM